MYHVCDYFCNFGAKCTYNIIRYMKKIAIAFAIFIAICVVAGVGSSCSRNVFDYDTYDSIVEIKSPVDTGDPNHTWTLSTKKFVIITVNGGVGAKKLQVLTDDPTTSKKAAVLAQNIVEEGDRFSMNVSFPTYLKNLYYAGKGFKFQIEWLKLQKNGLKYLVNSIQVHIIINI